MRLLTGTVPAKDLESIFGTNKLLHFLNIAMHIHFVAVSYVLVFKSYLYKIQVKTSGSLSRMVSSLGSQPRFTPDLVLAE